MSHGSFDTRREHAALTMMAAGAFLAAGGLAVVLVLDRSPLLVGGFGLAGALLWLFGYRAMLGQRGRGATTGVSSAPWPLVERSGHVAFWVLLGVLLLDSVWQVVPAGSTRIAYVYAGCLAALFAFAYAVVAE